MGGDGLTLKQAASTTFLNYRLSDPFDQLRLRSRVLKILLGEAIMIEQCLFSMGGQDVAI